ncbi:MAG: branched-chain amino acid transaminase [Myxococcales bacterium]|nr:branched-chain amino acid transaminase [Myxococcales bacterium]
MGHPGVLSPVSKIWLDGKLVDWSAASVHVLTHSLHYGVAAFEGIRLYPRGDGRSAVFRLEDHIGRLLDSCHICTLEPPFSRAELAGACLDTLRANRMTEAYIRPIIFLGDGGLGLGSRDVPTRVAVAAYQWGAYLGEDGVQTGIRAKVSSFTRGALNSAMSKGKISGQYVNSVLAKREVMRAGYEEAILLDAQGHVAEASGENIFIAKHGRLITPPLSSPILAGITRDTTITLARDLGITVEERTFARDELYIADEVFLTGTAAELTPVREVDDRRIGTGEPGSITRRLQETFFSLVRGAAPTRHAEWLSYL